MADDARGTPSPWIVQWAGLVPAGATVLDVAAGRGRHTPLLRRARPQVTAVDRDVGRLAGRSEASRSSPADLEDGSPVALAGPTVRRRGRDQLPASPADSRRCSTRSRRAACCSTRPSWTATSGSGSRAGPEFLLKDGELLELVRGRFSVIAYEARMISEPKMAMVQRIAARRPVLLSGYSAALATAGLCSTGAAYFRSCVSDGTILRASAILARSTSAITKPAFSPPASASTSPHGATAIEWP